MLKYLFLDIDGVLNCSTTKNRIVPGGAIIGVDPYKVLLLNRIIEATGAKIVLSSSWRHYPSLEEHLSEFTIPYIAKTGDSPCRTRGCEIRDWLEKNHPTRKERDELRCAILDDDTDFLYGQALFKTSWKEGLTEQIAGRVIKYLNQ